MRVHVLGAGIVGLACAEELHRRGHDVAVVDPRPGSGASRVAAGMLTPGGEAWYGEESTFRLGVESAALWEPYAARLGVPLEGAGTLLVGHDAGDAAQVLRQQQLLQDWSSSPVPVLGPAEVRRLEPSLARVHVGVRLPDRAVDPRKVVAALLTRLAGRVVPQPPPVRPEVTVVATGDQLPDPHAHLVRGVRGEILVLRPEPVTRRPGHVVRGWAAGEQVYLVPRADGRVVVGATSEEHDGPAVVTAGGVLRLLRAARALLPSVERAEVLECSAGNRPATPDHLPLVGPGLAPGQWLAAGTFRHGVLLAPLVARLLADSVAGAVPRPELDPHRFRTRPSTSMLKEKQCT